MLSVVSLGSWPLWLGFLGFVGAMLALDLGVFHRKAHAVSLREAAAWSGVWIALAALFALGVFHFYGAQPGLEFTTGYLIEKALSVDNIFVIVIVFGAFGVPAHQQHRVLFWGILGALAMRAVFIVAGTALIARFHWTVYVFGVFLVVTGARMLLSPGRAGAPGEQRARPPGPEGAPGRARSGHRALLHPGRRKTDGDPAVPGAAGGGVHRPHLRRRFHPGSAGRQPGPVHRLHLQHLCHPGAKVPLLPPGWRGAEVPLP